jgi:nitrogen fixation/metabolism regulation signal transduction histidine kinase
MASKAETRLGAVSGAGWRLLAALALVLALVQLLAATRHYASGLLLAGAALLLLVEAARLLLRSRAAPEQPAAALRTAARQRDEALALLDAVTVALFVVSGDGRIRFANRAARRIAGAEVARLGQIAALGEDAAARILALPVGGRQIVPLADGRNMLVWVGGVSTPEGGAQRLVSMQAVAGELDAVQVGAWHSMTRILAHEMMNALTPISSLSESLGRLTSALPDAAAAAETIARQSRHLMSFVERYRAIVDLPQPAMARIPLSAFMSDLATLAGAELGHRGIAFAAGGAPEDDVAADADLLRQALLNLLRNAGDAALAGGGAPAVRLSCARSGAEVLFDISDNGPGVAPEHLEDMFVPFFTTKEGGAGIGLTLARQVALAHGGRLDAAANGERGMTFTLALPA